MIPKTPIKAIRAKCLDCCCGSSMEVKSCTKGPQAKHPCSLFPYRLGTDPKRKRAYTPEQRARMAESMKMGRRGTGKIPETGHP